MSKSLAPLLRHGARRGLPTLAGFSRGGTAQGPTRRDLLRAGGVGVAAALLGPLAGCASQSGGKKAAAANPNRNRTVIVVGAGFGGLACADTLAHAGVKVVLLEASGRAGGRVRSDRLFIPGDTVELGGEWIGSNHPTWLAYAQEFSLLLEEPNAPPIPQNVPESATPPTPEPGAPPTTGPAPSTGPRRPVPFETEMELEPAPQAAPGGGQAPGGAPQVSVPTRVIAAAMLQPAQGQDAPAPAPAPEPAPAPPPAPDRPADAPRQSDTTSEAPHAQPPTPRHDIGDEPIILNGKLIRGEEADRLYQEVDAVLAKAIGLARGVDPVRPWTSPNAAELDARSFADFIGDQQGLSEQGRRMLLITAESDNGVPAERMSLLAYAAMVAGGGFQDYYDESETYRVAEGNDALATALAQKLGNRIHFNSYVDMIRRTPDGVIVRTRGGDFYRGDALVLATPPSTWNTLRIEPPLDERLAPQMGENVKFVLALREAVWEKDGLASQSITDGLIGLTWAATDEHARGPVGWTLFSGATQAENLRRLAPFERQREVLASLAPAYPTLGDAIVNQRFVDWPGMPLTRASYSFPAPGQVTRFGPVLVEGIVQEGLPPVMFAGEHTSYAFIGYMEGALSSGVRAAQLLLALAKPGPATQPAETQPAGTQPAETQPAGTQPADTQPGTQPADTQPATQPVPPNLPAAEPVREGTPA